MKDTVILYGTSTGTTQEIAQLIATKLNINDVYDVATFSIENIYKYKNLILGSPTLGYGDLQDDWEVFLPQLAKQDLNEKNIALFGLGDCDCYNDSFVSAMGIIYNALQNKGAKFVGEVDAGEYTFTDSEACINGKFVGLPIDEENERIKTEERVDNWLSSVKPFFE